MKKDARPKGGDMVTNTGMLKANVGLFYGVVVANLVDDVCTDHVMESGDFCLTEGLIGIKVRTPSIYVQHVFGMLQYVSSVLNTY